MSDFDEGGRALIALASDAHDPTDADRARVRAALAARLGAAAGLGLGTVAAVTATAKAATSVGVTSSAAATGAGGATAAGSVLVTKLIGLAVVITTTVGVGAGVTIKLTRRSAHDPGPAKTSEIHRHRTTGAAPRELPPPVSEQAPPEEPWSDEPAVGLVPSHEASAAQPAPPPEAERALKREARDGIGTGPRRRSATASGAGDGASAPPPSGTDLGARRPESAVAEEARLVNEGVRALRAGQPASALSLFDTHARLYPDGVLAEERDAERALALADLGKLAEARAAATAFLHRHPASPLGVRLRQRIPEIDGAGTETPTAARLP